MSLLVKNGGNSLPWEKPREYTQPVSANVDGIDNLYLTSQTEEERTTFSETFPEKNQYSTHISSQQASAKRQIDAHEFWDALCDFREDNPKKGVMSLRDRLELSDDEYDSLACIALGIATQETGMGWENEYKNEQDGIDGLIRKLGIIGIGEHSASSGMTQIKIYDQIKELDTWDKGILAEYGIKTSSGILGKGFDNLNDARKSAVSTMVILKNIMDNYDNYQANMNERHNEIAQQFEDKGINSQAAQETGFNYMSQIYNYFQNATPDEQMQIKDSMAGLFLAENGTTLENPSNQGKEYTEEYQLNKLNEALGKNGNIPLEAIEYIRLAMTSEDAQLDATEYCAYAWNKGVGATGMQPDRAIAEKMGIIFSNSEILGKNQYDYAANVVNYAIRYANQTTGGQDGYYAINDPLEKEEDNEAK